MQNLIVNGNLHCTKQECAKLAAIQLRIIELSYLKKLEEEEREKQEKLRELEAAEKLRAVAQSDTSTSSSEPSVQEENQSILELSREIVKIKSEQEKLEDLKHKNDLVNNVNSSTNANTNQTALNNTPKTETIKEEDEEDNDKEESKLLRTNDLDYESIRQDNADKMLVIILTNGRCESLKLYLESCSCLSQQKTAKTLDLKNLVHPNYKRSRDIIKLIEVEN